MSSASDFVIENGVLKKYTGPGGDVVISAGVTSIGDSVFNGCRSLTSVTIPGSVTSISDSAFRDCSSMTNVTIPEGVTSIDKDAFRGCGNLSIILPDSLHNAEPAFAKCVCQVKLRRWSPVIAILMKNTSIEAVDVEDFLSLPAALRQHHLPAALQHRRQPGCRQIRRRERPGRRGQQL